MDDIRVLKKYRLHIRIRCMFSAKSLRSGEACWREYEAAPCILLSYYVLNNVFAPSNQLLFQKSIKHEFSVWRNKRAVVPACQYRLIILEGYFFPPFCSGVEPNPLSLRPLLAYCTDPRWLWMISVEQSVEYLEKPCSSAVLSTTNPTWPEPTSPTVQSRRLIAWATARPLETYTRITLLLCYTYVIAPVCEYLLVTEEGHTV
jgi:hypothetical protein